MFPAEIGLRTVPRCHTSCLEAHLNLLHVVEEPPAGIGQENEGVLASSRSDVLK